MKCFRLMQKGLKLAFLGRPSRDQIYYEIFKKNIIVYYLQLSWIFYNSDVRSHWSFHLPRKLNQVKKCHIRFTRFHTNLTGLKTWWISTYYKDTSFNTCLNLWKHWLVCARLPWTTERFWFDHLWQLGILWSINWWTSWPPESWVFAITTKWRRAAQDTQAYLICFICLGLANW